MSSNKEGIFRCRASYYIMMKDYEDTYAPENH